MSELTKIWKKCLELYRITWNKKINGSYLYETPTYLYKEKDDNLVDTVNIIYNFSLL